MPSIAPFLPPHLLQSIAGCPPASLPHTESFSSALLFADISGFTALTERLQRKGRRGAEEIAAVVNRAFRPAIAAIEREGGSIVGFGGDALLTLFPGAGAVERARVAAKEIRTRVERTRGGGTGLSVSQAIHHGTVRALHLGSEHRRHYLVGGPTVQAVVRQEGAARP